MATRSQVREVVVQLLYAYGSGNDGISKFVKDILEKHKIKNAQKDFALDLFFGTVENIEILDLCIIHQLTGWDFSRIGEVERAILRLGSYEIIFSKIDKAVVINEALEIARNFGYESSVKFINGVLDGITKNCEIPLEQIKESLKQQKLEAKTLEIPNIEETLKESKPKLDKAKTKSYKKPQSQFAKPKPKYSSKKNVKESQKDSKVRKVSQRSEKES